MHRKWPNGLTLTQYDYDAAHEGQRNILSHFGNYLWISLCDVLELHLPYVNGWGRTYNFAAAISSLIVYFGMLIGWIRMRWRREYVFFLVIMAYSTGLFSLTDATPRYLMPTIFCYIAFAGVGFDLLWNALRRTQVSS